MASSNVAAATAASNPKFTPGSNVYFRRPSDKRTRRGTLLAEDGDGWLILARPDGKLSSRASRELFVSLDCILSEQEFCHVRRSRSGRTEAVSSTRRVVSVAESNRRAAVAAERFPYSEEQIITTGSFLQMMRHTVAALARKNNLPIGNWINHGGMSYPSNLEAGELVSEYVTAAANSLRRELASAPQHELDAFRSYLGQEGTKSRIFATVTVAGRGAVIRELKARAKRHAELFNFQDDTTDRYLHHRQVH